MQRVTPPAWGATGHPLGCWARSTSSSPARLEDENARIELSNGAVLAYDDQGPVAGDAVVLIHGISMSRRYFRGQLDPLAASIG